MKFRDPACNLYPVNEANTAVFKIKKTPKPTPTRNIFLQNVLRIQISVFLRIQQKRAK